MDQVISSLKKYGSKAVNWANKNKGKILHWITLDGLPAPEVVAKIKSILGLK